MSSYPAQKMKLWRPVFTERLDCLGVALRANDTDRQPGIFIAKTLSAGRVPLLWFSFGAVLFVRKMLANIPSTNPIQASRPEQNGAIEDSNRANHLATISRSLTANSLISPISDIRSLEMRNNTSKHMYLLYPYKFYYLHMYIRIYNMYDL